MTSRAASPTVGTSSTKAIPSLIAAAGFNSCSVVPAILQQPLRKTRTDVRELECMQPQVARQLLACQNPAHAIALRIQLRRVHPNTDLPVHNAQDASPHAT